MGSAHVRAFGILGLLRRSTRPVGLSAIAKEQQLATSSVHAILSDLLAVDAITIDSDKRYWLGPNLFYLGSAFAANSAIYRGAWNELIDLAQELQVSAAIAVPWERHHLVVAVHRNSGRGPALTPGTRVPLDGGSYGKVYYAMSDDPVPTEPNAQSTVVDFDRFAADIATARERGYATDDEEFAPGVSALAAAITSERGYEGLVALWASPADRLRVDIGFEKGGAMLRELADRVSLILGDLSREHVWAQSG
jgi:IclR family acetate operon transcriptional repressor